MANHQVKNAAASTVYLKATGDGSNGDPFIIEHLETNSDAIAGLLASIDTNSDSLVGIEGDTGAINTATTLVAAAVSADDGGLTPGTSKGMTVNGLAKPIDGTDPGSVSAENDAAIVITDLNRRLLVSQAHPNLWRVNENHSSAQTNNNLKAAPGASLSLYITDIMFSCDTNCSFALVEDEGGTPATIWGAHYFGARGGIAMPLITPIKMTANKTLGFTQVGGGNYNVSIHGYIAP